MEIGSEEAKTCLLESVIISIKDIEHNATPVLSLHSSYVTYQIKTRPLIKEKAEKLFGILESVFVWRRYSDFEVIRDQLIDAYPAIIVPPLPEKRVNPTLDGMVTYAWHKLLLEVNEDEEFLERRRKRLEKFLQRIASHPILCRDARFLDFLTKKSSERDGAEYGNNTIPGNYPPKGGEESPLPPPPSPSAMDGSFTESSQVYERTNGKTEFTEPDTERWKLVESYVASLRGHIAGLLKLRKEMIEKLYLIHKIHGNYGRIFFEWSKSEPKLGEVLTKAGKLMTEYALAVDNFVSVEEDWEDNLREYESYAEILKGLCKRYHTLSARCRSFALNSTNGAVRGAIPNGANGHSGGIAAGDQEPTTCSGAATKLTLSQPINGLKNLWENLSHSSPGPQQSASRETFVEHCNANFEINGEAMAAKDYTQARDDLIAFDMQATQEIRNFQKQKDREIRNFLKEYAQNQVQLHTKSLEIWARIKDNFSTA